MTTYAEKLRDPRWQKKRLEILNRDGWRCCWCYDHESTLHVHHGCYRKGRDPWDYPNETLHTVCEHCHPDADIQREELQESCARLWPEGASAVHQLIDYIALLRNGDQIEFCQQASDLAVQWILKEDIDGWEPCLAITVVRDPKDGNLPKQLEKYRTNESVVA